MDDITTKSKRGFRKIRLIINSILLLFSIIIIIFALVIIFPHLPNLGPGAFKGIPIIIGLIMVVVLAGIISNVTAKVILTSIYSYKVGDRVKINDIVGDVINKNLFVTRLKILNKEEITIPHSTVINGNVVNYSAIAEQYGLVLHTTITMGHDVPWKQIHKLLETAALQTALIEKEPKPFVLQKSLDDWSVTYELNAYTKAPKKMSKIYSDLHGNILDKFNEVGLEIGSSHYMALLDGNQVKVTKGYKIPPFKVDGTTIKNGHNHLFKK